MIRKHLGKINILEFCLGRYLNVNVTFATAQLSVSKKNTGK